MPAIACGPEERFTITCLDLLDTVGNLPVHVQEFLVDDEELGLAVVQDVEEAVAAERRVDGDRVHADFLGADEKVQVLRAVPHHDGETLAPAAAEGLQIVCRPVRVFVHLAIVNSSCLRT